MEDTVESVKVKVRSILNDVDGMDVIIHNLQKVESKMLAGRFFDARRELLRVISALDRNRADIREYLANLVDSKGGGS